MQANKLATPTVPYFDPKLLTFIMSSPELTVGGLIHELRRKNR